MARPARLAISLSLAAAAAVVSATALAQHHEPDPLIGDERAVPRHLLRGEEFALPLPKLLDHGRLLFMANWTDQDGAGRPLTTGTGAPLVDRTRPLAGLRAMNRVSGPDANSCAGCHNMPDGIPGGAGDFASVVFQMAQRFDFATFDRSDTIRRRGSLDESGRPATLQTIGNARATPDLFGAGYLEMLARQITVDLQRIRDGLEPGQSRALVSTGISFGTLSRGADGRWVTRRVEGLPPQSLATRDATDKPSLAVRPWQASGSTVSLRELNNTALNQHFGIQSSERFGVDADPDGDGVANEVTRGDVTALTAFVATLPVPGRVVPTEPAARRAVEEGERAFARVGCTACHVPSLALRRSGWIYTEPGPGTAGGMAPSPSSRRVAIDLADPALPQPRLRPDAGRGVVDVPAFTDFKLHDITDAADAEAAEPLDLNQPSTSRRFLQGNRRFLTRRLWAVGSAPAHYHHGLFTSIRQAVLAHAGEALESRRAFERLEASEQQTLVAFLESLQVLPSGR